MTGPELKAAIFQHLESRGWVNRKPGEYYAWDPPGESITGQAHYCWHAALLMAMATEEGTVAELPAGAFEVVVGGRKR